MIYTVPKGRISGYLLEVLKRGRCPYLVPGSYYEDEGGICICLDTSGLRELSSLGMEKRRSGLGPAIHAARSIRYALRDLTGLGDWLIDPRSVSLKPQKVFWDEDLAVVRFCPAAPDEDSGEGPAGLVRALDRDSFGISLGISEMILGHEQDGTVRWMDIARHIKKLGDIEDELCQ
ncbi:MAG: hypothetical protein IJK59_05920 [Firmicutes bacterium]|nr:hypothetical protein [Bacillota bacterium]MBR0113734.1 hypothetical protein [Bacillota bacterium]